MKRTAVSRTAHHPVTVGTGPQFLCMCIVHHAYHNIAQNNNIHMSIFYSNPGQGPGVVGNFLFFIPYKSVFTLTFQNCLYFGEFSSSKFRDMSAFAHFVVLPCTYFDFFSNIKRVQYRTYKTFFIIKKLSHVCLLY